MRKSSMNEGFFIAMRASRRVFGVASATNRGSLFVGPRCADPFQPGVRRGEMCLVYSAVSGEILAIVDDYEGKTAKEMKQFLGAQIGVTRFRQRFLSSDGSREIEDDEVFTSQPVEVRLLLLEFCPPEFEEDQRMISATRDNDSLVLQELLHWPRNPNISDVDGFTPLHYAAANGHIKPTLLLLEAGARKNARDGTAQGTTPLICATGNGHLEVVRLLVEAGADRNKSRSTDGASPLYIAAQNGRSDVYDLLVEAVLLKLLNCFH